jgi:hypothetical protein
MADRLMKLFFKKKQKINCIQVSRPECRENHSDILKRKIEIDFDERGKFYSALFSQQNYL